MGEIKGLKIGLSAGTHIFVFKDIFPYPLHWTLRSFNNYMFEYLKAIL